MSIRLLPSRRLRLDRVDAIQCGLCGQWHNPRHIRIPAIVCRNCETTLAFQTWTRRPMHSVTKSTTPARVR